MHSSRMRTARSLTVSPYLVVSPTHTPPPQEQPHMPPWEQLHMPPWSNHACPPGATTHTPRSNHACPPRATTPPRATMYTPWEQPHTPQEQPCMPPSQEQPCMPPGSNHACPPEQPCMPAQQPCMPPQATMHAPPVNRMTNRCKNITLPQTSFAGSNKEAFQ